MVPHLSAVESQLKKKASFEEAVKKLDFFFSETFSQSDEESKREALRLLGRTHTLLKSRYSSLPFWEIGQALFLTALANVTGSANDFRKVSEYLECAEAVIADARAAAGSTSHLQEPLRSQQLLFEGQLSQAPNVPSENPSVDVSDLLEYLVSARLGNQAHFFPRTDTRNGGRRSDGIADQRESGEMDGAVSEAGLATSGGADDLANQMHRIQQRIMEALETSNVGMESVLAGMETVEQGVQDVLHAMGGDEGELSAPPAAKVVVESLPGKVLVEEDISTLGKDTTCPVCMDAFQCGDKMTGLPCKHVFHIGCLKRWLKRRNSCPLCRHELPTDDREYELRKEREEERRGAENALSHNEFMYI